MDKRSLSERDICTKFITPALRKAGWDEMLQIREEVSFTKGRIIVRGKLVSRGKAKRADYILYFNIYMTKRGWRDDYAEKLAASKAKRGWSDRADLQTSFDLQDAEEGRK